MTGAVAAAMAAAATQWLASLGTDQRREASRPWPSDPERHAWYYTPTDHGGLPLARMTPGQQQLAMRFLTSGLSRAGFVTVSTIMGLENTLDELEGFEVNWSRERGRDPNLYWFTVFGIPGRDSWSWRFGGHHISVHHTIVAGHVTSSTPTFFGADPASSRSSDPTSCVRWGVRRTSPATSCAHSRPTKSVSRPSVRRHPSTSSPVTCHGLCRVGPDPLPPRSGAPLPNSTATGRGWRARG